MILLLFFVALALGVSFLCSVLESVLLSITPGHVSLLEQQKHPNDVPYSRLPLLEERNGSRRCTGYVLRDDVLELAANDQHGIPVSRVRRDVLAVTRQKPVPDVFDRLVDRREHIALVTDGDRLAGIVTLEDIFEALLGVAIEDEGDYVSAPPGPQSRR